MVCLQLFKSKTRKLHLKNTALIICLIFEITMSRKQLRDRITFVVWSTKVWTYQLYRTVFLLHKNETLHPQHLCRTKMNHTVWKHNKFSKTVFTAGSCRFYCSVKQQDPCCTRSPYVQEMVICEDISRCGGNKNAKSCNFSCSWTVM